MKMTNENFEDIGIHEQWHYANQGFKVICTVPILTNYNNCSMGLTPHIYFPQFTNLWGSTLRLEVDTSSLLQHTNQHRVIKNTRSITQARNQTQLDKMVWAPDHLSDPKQCSSTLSEENSKWHWHNTNKILYIQWRTELSWGGKTQIRQCKIKSNHCTMICTSQMDVLRQIANWEFHHRWVR